MVIVLGMFVTVAAVIIGSYWLLVAVPEQKQQVELRKRVAGVQPKKTKRTRIIKEDRHASSIPLFDAALDRVTALSAPVEQMLEQAGLKWNIGTFVLLIGCAGLLAFLVAWVALHSMLLALPAGVLGALLPVLFVRFRRTRRIRRFEEQFPEAIELIARALRAGHAFPTGLSMVAEEMAPPVGPEFKLLYDEQNYGLSLPEAMRNFARRIPLLDARFFVTAVLTQRESGGNLSEVLDNLAAVIRERFKVKRQIRVISAHGRITGWILSLLPVALAVVLMFLVPGHIQKLFTNTLGKQMIAAALVLEVVGALLIRKIVQVEY